MGSIILLILYIAVFIAQIILLVFSIKRKEKKYWIKIFLTEIISIIISCVLFVYYRTLPGYGFMPGLSYLEEILLSFGAAILYSGMLFITICAKIIIFEKQQKQQGKKHKNPVILIIALIFITIGIYYLTCEIIENWGCKKTIGTVIGFEEEVDRYYFTDSEGNREERILYDAIISFEVNDKKYQDSIYKSNVSIGDTVEIGYISGDSLDTPYILTYLEDNKTIYIPTFIIGILIIFLRFKNNIFIMCHKEKK